MHEGIGVVGPLKLLETDADGAIEILKMLLEKQLFLLADQVHDVVVVTHDEHDVLLQDAKLLTTVMQLSQIDMQVDKAMLLYLVPVVNFNRDLAEV